MGDRMNLSYEDNPDFYSKISSRAVVLNNKDNLKNLVKDSYSFIIRYLSLLPMLDHDLAKLYYIDGLSQEQIRDLFQISQSAVSRRLRYIFNRINFLLRAPSLNPIQVREDLEFLFTPELFEYAYFYYFELAQNRVKYFVQSSQSGVANKFKEIIRYLDNILEENNTKIMECDKDIMIQDKKGCLALIYLDYFRFIRDKSNIISYLCKKNDEIRSNSLILGEPILG